jgi:hypothetical protein
MTQLEIQIHILKLNSGQRLALLIGIVNHYKIAPVLSLEGLEDLLKIWKPEKQIAQRRLQP